MIAARSIIVALFFFFTINVLQVFWFCRKFERAPAATSSARRTTRVCHFCSTHSTHILCAHQSVALAIEPGDSTRSCLFLARTVLCNKAHASFPWIEKKVTHTKSSFVCKKSAAQGMLIANQRHYPQV